MDALLGTKLTYEKVQAKIEAVRVAKGQTANPNEYMALEKKATTYTKAQEFAKAIDLWIELVATASKSNQAVNQSARPASHQQRSRGVELLCNAKRARGEPSAFSGTAGPDNGRVVIASVAGAAFLGSVESLW